MKRLFSSKTLLALLALAQIHTARAATIKVIAEGIEETKGSIRLSMFNSEEGWLKEGIRAEIIEAKAPEITWEVLGLEPGEYAVSIFHDVDDDGKLNTGAFGMPTEPYGFSNNARGMFGPAKWKNAKFVVEESDREIRIKLD